MACKCCVALVDHDCPGLYVYMEHTCTQASYDTLDWACKCITEYVLMLDIGITDHKNPH